jgi:signal transduction histidine kinase/ligand-binding sensor domain-containing protein
VVLPEPIHKAGLLNLSLSRVFFLLFVLAATAWAVDPHTLISQYGHTAWRNQDGFALGSGAITQTTDGYIWIKTSTGGLTRFDGVRFTPWAAPKGQSLAGTGFSYLLGGRDGSLWIGTYGGLSRLKDGKLFNYTTTPHSPGISAIIEDHAGTIWLTRYHVNDGKGSLCQVVGDALRCYGEKDGNRGRYGLGLAEDSAGNIWFGCKMLCRWAPGSSSFYFREQLKNQSDGVKAVAAGPSGSMWAALDGTGLGLGVRYYSYGQWASYIVPRFDGSTIRSQFLFVDRNQTLWVGTQSQGLYRIHDGVADHYGSANGLSGDTVDAIYEDKEGNLWVTTDMGLDMFRDRPIVTFSPNGGLMGADINSILALSSGSVWVGKYGALDIIRAGRVSAIAAGHGLPGQNVTAMLEDSTGQVWLGIDNTLAAYKLGSFSDIKTPIDRPLRHAGSTEALAEDVEGNIWALTQSSAPEQRHLFRVRDRSIKQDIRVDGIIGAIFLAADRNAGVWLSSAYGQFVHYREGKAEAVVSLGSEEIGVRSFSVDSDNAVWSATRKGLYRWKDGRMSVMDARNGLPCSSIYSMIKDNSGSFWLYAQCGLMKISATDWAAWLKFPESKISVKIFDTLDGAQPSYGPGEPLVSKSADGRLWFASSGIVQMIDPSRTFSNVIPPPVYVEEVIADRKNYLPGVGLRLPALTRDLEIDYTALSFSVPQKVRFRYKMQGRDAGWQEPGTRRQAFYTDLHPGNYRFRVIACNNDGLWNEEGATLDFNIAPAWYQTNWFRMASAATLLMLLYLFYQIRLRQLHHQFSIGLEARVNERTRIARELHDTLLQSFQGLMLRFQTVDEMLPARPLDAKKALEGALDRADEAISEGRDAITDIRTSTLASHDLAKSIAALMTNLNEELAAGNRGSVMFRVLVEGAPRTVRPILQDEIYRIARESLRNAFRHAQARNIETEITYGESLRLRFRDDGKGIDPSVVEHGGRSGHWGLPGIRERAKHIGAKLAVWSELGAGTEVELSIPGSIAYEVTSAGSRFRFFRKRTEQHYEHRS